MKTIALDFDDTYTAMPAIWDAFIEACQKDGHVVTFVTLRGKDANNDDIESAADRLGINAVYCNGLQKSTQFNADIWVDDMPLLVPSADAMRGLLLGCEKMGE